MGSGVLRLHFGERQGEYSPNEISRFEPLNRRLALAEAEARQRPGVRQPSGALEVVGGRKRQRPGALQDLSAVRTVHGKPRAWCAKLQLRAFLGRAELELCAPAHGENSPNAISRFDPLSHRIALADD